MRKLVTLMVALGVAFTMQGQSNVGVYSIWSVSEFDTVTNEWSEWQDVDKILEIDYSNKNHEVYIFFPDGEEDYSFKKITETSTEGVTDSGINYKSWNMKVMWDGRYFSMVYVEYYNEEDDVSDTQIILYLDGLSLKFMVKHLFNK